MNISKNEHYFSKPLLELEYITSDYDTGVIPVKINTFRNNEKLVEIGNTAPSLKKKCFTIIWNPYVSGVAPDILLLAQLKSIVDANNLGKVPVYLKMPCVPYSRQDRTKDSLEAHSLKIFANMLNYLHFNAVYVLSPHSDVTLALVDNVKDCSSVNSYYVDEALLEIPFEEEIVLVAPDAGATKRVEKISDSISFKNTIVQGLKKREEDGTLGSFKVYGEVNDKHCLIIDDLCEGGGTFIGIAEELHKLGAKSVNLYVTHFMQPGRVDYILGRGIDKIFTTNSTGLLKVGSFDYFSRKDALTVYEV